MWRFFVEAIEDFLWMLKKKLFFETFMVTAPSNHQRPVKKGFITKGVSIMKNKMICALLTTVMVLSFAACGSQGNSTASTESTVTSESQTTESSSETAAETTIASDAASETSYEDNFAVPTEDAVAFAKEIQAAVANEDLEALADLTHYPVYVSIADGSVIESKEDLIALGADKIFTDEMKDSIANAGLSDLSPSMAGFTLYSTGDAPNMIFSVQDGRLGISGMNY